MRPSWACQAGRACSIFFKNVRNSGFPNRLPVSSGGHCSTIFSASCRIRSILPSVSVMSLSLMLDTLRSTTLSAMLKMKACTSVHVGLFKNNSWSSGLRMRRVGCVYVCDVRSGGGAKVGVGGGGAEGALRGFEVRFRGMSLGSLAPRSGGGEAVGRDGVVVIL